MRRITMITVVCLALTMVSGTAYAADSFEASKEAALQAIEEANLPDAAAFAEEGNTICIPDQDIVTWPQYSFTGPTIPAEVDATMHPFTQYPIGHPAIESEYGSVEATGVFALLDEMVSLAPEDYDLAADEDFANFLAFADLYTPAAVAGTPVVTKRYNVVSTVQCEDPDPAFVSSQPYHVYKAAVEVGEGPCVLRVLDSIPISSPFALGSVTYDSLEAYVYDLGLNSEGVVVSYQRVPTDNVQSYSAVEDGKIRIGYYLDEVFPIAEGAKLYSIKNTTEGEGWFVTVIDSEITEASFDDLTQEDWNDSILAVFNDNGEIEEAYLTAVEGQGEPPADLEAIQKYTFEYGVEPDDPVYGYDGVENPFAVNYALYDPTTQEGADQEALYPLFVFFHGIGGGHNKNALPTNETRFGVRYVSEEYQSEFETATEGVHGAYIMLPRSNETASHDLGSQGWLTGYRAETNPRYALGDEAYKGKTTQAPAVVADIRRLIDEKHIDPNRVYVAGFSAGGYMTWNTLFEGGDIFAAASPQGAAFFPEGGQLEDDYSEFDLGLKDKLLKVKDIPIWMIHSRNDDTCVWDMAAGDPAKDEANYINGFAYLPQMVRSFSDGVSEIQGSPLTRVTIHNYLHTGEGELPGSQHSAQMVVANNKYTGVTVDGTELTWFDVAYAEKPEDYDEANPSEEAQGSLYAYGINLEYSTPESWNGTFISWLNACGDARTEANAQ